jgi:hypothetical protein
MEPGNRNHQRRTGEEMVDVEEVIEPTESDKVVMRGNPISAVPTPPPNLDNQGRYPAGW